MKDALLEYIYGKSSVAFISDLRSPHNLAENIHLLDEIDQDAFSLEDWNCFAMYVTGTTKTELSIADVIQTLKQYAGIKSES